MALCAPVSSKPVSGQRPLTGRWETVRFVTASAFMVPISRYYIEIVNFACRRGMAALAIELTLWEFALTITTPLRS